MGPTGSVVKYAVIGAVLFWTPSVLLHALHTDAVWQHDITFLTVVPVLASLGGLLMLRRFTASATGPLLIGLSMLLGIWLFGPFLIMVSATFSGGGFAHHTDWRGLVTALALFPVMTPMMALYDGTLAALGLVSMALVGASIWLYERSAEQ